MNGTRPTICRLRREVRRHFRREICPANVASKAEWPVQLCCSNLFDSSRLGSIRKEDSNLHIAMDRLRSRLWHRKCASSLTRCITGTYRSIEGF